ncbi:MAG: hypothetical protein ACE37F_05270 [Nannocystaceae bacterium]|nr:hypothetical protein [bacterium]
MHLRRTFLLGLGASACAPRGDAALEREPEVELGADLLPGERLVAFVRWLGGGGSTFASLMIYASGHLGYRLVPVGGERATLRVAEASMDEISSLRATLDDEGFRAADPAYAWEASSHGPFVSVYAPASHTHVQVFGMPKAMRLPVALGDALRAIDGMRSRAERGADPFSSIVPRVARPLVIHSKRRRARGDTRDVSIYDNGALELRSLPDAVGTGDPAWALTRRLRAGTLAELREYVHRFENRAHTNLCGPTSVCDRAILTARTRRLVGPRRSAAAQQLVEAIDRTVEGLEAPMPS